ncbi:hypothetical protein Aspvir_004119 [Aspergillus viridinutans]|uniref:DUF6603 domain-containing protein n=1 Tax=Aspergillus viridinutans TaxID=75553 RepID=A0A9P3F0A5_ASPVI|nr:uncharacterized protein Aspvir_004119 [Aspergillus viridinutans]GIK00104.1 hypothetical protein Aspvir_004119 [Aspergillus viridinutans]
MANFGVDTIHLNVGVGDCEIVLQVDLSDSTRLPKIVKAVLIDGGYPTWFRGRAVETINKFIKFGCRRRYRLPDGDTTLMLDAIVITHWDQDHYGGIVCAMEQDLQQAILNDVVNRGHKDQLLAKNRCSFLRYGPDTASGARGPPLTTVYVPYWTPIPPQKAPHSLLELQEEALIHYLAVDVTPFAVFGDRWWMGKVALLRSTYVENIGRDLFTDVWAGNPATPLVQATFATPRDLAVALKLRGCPGGRPALAIVGCQRENIVPPAPSSSSRTLPRAPSPSFTLPSNPPVPVRPHRPVLRMVNRPEVKDEADTTNAASIICVVIWVDTGVIGHFMGGDAFWTQEIPLVKWIAGPPESTSRIGAVKLSHHGSASSTPTTLFSSLCPRSIIVSAYDDYYHPRWEIILWLDAYIRTTTLRGPMRLYSMVYPYYLNAVVSASGTVSTSAKANQPVASAIIPTKSKDIQAFQTSLGNLISAFTGSSAWTGFTFTEFMATYTDTPQVGLDYLVLKVHDAWRNLSDVTARQNIWDPFSMQSIFYQLVRTRAAPDEDGEVVTQNKDFWFKQQAGRKKKTVRRPPKAVSFVRTNPRPARAAVRAKEATQIRIEQARKAMLARQVQISGAQDEVKNAMQPADLEEGDKGVEAGGLQQPFSGAFGKVAVAVAAATPADETPVTYPTSGYYICIDAAIVTSASNVLSLSHTGDQASLNNLIDSLNTGVLALSAAPDSAGQALLDGTTEAGCDEWFFWLSSAIGATSVKAVRHQSDPSSSPVSSFTISTIDPWALTFSTEGIALAFHSNDLPVIPPIGFQVDQNTLILGLEKHDLAAIWTLDRVLDFMGIENQVLLGLSSAFPIVPDFTPGTRNAIWFTPCASYRTVMRLQFKFSDPVTWNSWMTTLHLTNITFSEPKLVLKRTVTRFEIPGDFELYVDSELMVTTTVSVVQNNAASPVDAVLIFDPSFTTLVLQPRSGSLSDIFAWLITALHLDAVEANAVNDVSNWLAAVSSHLPSVREVQVMLDTSGILMFRVKFVLEVDFGKDPGNAADKKVAFIFTYTYNTSEPKHIVSGSLWTPVFAADLQSSLPLRFDPIYEDFQTNDGVPPEYRNFLHLSALFPDLQVVNVPAELNLEVFDLEVSLSSDNLYISGTLIRDPTIQPEHFALDSVTLGAAYYFAKPASPGHSARNASSTVNFSAQISMLGHTPKDNATLLASIDYVSNDSEDSTWHLHGGLRSVTMGTLVSLFPGGDRQSVMDLAEHFSISSLNLDYIYSSSGKGSQFQAEAVLILDVFQLSMDFTWQAGKAWSIVCTLQASPGVDTTFIQVLKAVMPDSAVTDMIPNFANFRISSADSSQNGTRLTFNMDKTANYITAVLTLFLKGNGDDPDITCSLIQIKEPTVTTGSGAPKPAATKRLLRVTVGSIPWGDISSIPLVGKIQKPFDELDYIWVHDDSNVGLTRDDITCINSIPEPQRIYVHDTKPKPAGSDVLLVTGSHFLVVGQDKSVPAGQSALLDYVFGHAAQTPGPQSDLGPAEPSGGTTMAKLDSHQGPLSVKNFGLRYSDSTLHIVFDATVKLGPIEFALLGFSIGLQFSQGIDLRTLYKAHLSVSLQGMECSYAEPPMILAGIFEDLSTDTMTKYIGGVDFQFEPYSFLAVGSYGELKDATGSMLFKSVFVFAKLDGPLIEFEFAEVSGITAGFGYNSALRFPSLPELPSFPFVSNPSGLSTTDPVELLQALTSDGAQNPSPGWVSMRNGSIWLAAGLEVKAFQILSVNAIVVLEFNPYVSLGLFAKAAASMPAATDGKPLPPGESFLYVELGLAAAIDFHAGTMRVEGSLTPNSYVLNPMCHLSGGFALCYWFQGSQHEGDWVFTIGGYHAAFQPPDHYPRPDRLQIQWYVGGGLNITGQAYFAITPKVCMGGGLLSACLDLGPLHAYFDAWADFLMTYKPFYFVGDVGVQVGVEFTLDLWICTIHINVHIGAALNLYGPPFGGEVWVDFWVFGFSIHFGNDRVDQAALTLPQFYQLLLQQEAPHTTPTGSTNSDHVLSIEAGRQIINSGGESTDVPEGEPWKVKSQGFICRVQSRFAIESADVNGVSPVTTKTRIYSKPMHLTAPDPSRKIPDEHITSAMKITIKGHDDAMGTFTCKEVYKKVPQASWGSYDPNSDPLLTHNGNDALLDHSADLTTDRIMGISVIAPKPFLPLDPIQPFDALAADSLPVLPDDSDTYRPAFLSTLAWANDAWTPQPHPAGVASDNEILWKLAETAWQAATDLGDDGTGKKILGLADVVEDWKDVMGWSGGIDAEIPTQVMNRFEQLYMSAPFVGVV